MASRMSLTPAKHGVEGDEVGLGAVGDHPGQGGLARARRTIEDQAAQLVRLDGPAQQAAWADDVILAHELVQGARAHTVRQGGVGGDAFLAGVVEEIHRELKIEI